MSSVDHRVPQELFLMQRFSPHLESILAFLQAKDSSAGFLKKNGGKCINAALLLAEWYRLTCNPLRARSVYDTIAAMWSVLSDAQLKCFGLQVARWMRDSLPLLSSGECHEWFRILRSIHSNPPRSMSASELLCAHPALSSPNIAHHAYFQALASRVHVG
jgi:hypothetical protein